MTELEGCHSISVRVKFAKTNRLSTLTVDGGRNTFPLPIRGRPRAGEGEASVSPDRKDLGPFADHPTRGPLSWLEWGEPREGKRLRFYAPSGFLTFRIRLERHSRKPMSRSRKSITVPTCHAGGCGLLSGHADGVRPGGTGPARTGSTRVGPDNRRIGYPEPTGNQKLGDRSESRTGILRDRRATQRPT